MADKKLQQKTVSAPTDLIIRPRITEKSTALSERNAYVFDVSQRATKNEIKKAIVTLYKVTPLKIAVSVMRAKNVFKRGKKGKTAGGKKAVVYLKKGDKITIM